MTKMLFTWFHFSSAKSLGSMTSMKGWGKACQWNNVSWATKCPIVRCLFRLPPVEKRLLHVWACSWSYLQSSFIFIFIVIISIIIISDICIIIISLVVAICTARPSVIGLACRWSSSVTNRAIRIDLRFPPQEGKYCQICAAFAFASNLLTCYFSQNKKGG